MGRPRRRNDFWHFARHLHACRSVRPMPLPPSHPPSVEGAAIWLTSSPGAKKLLRFMLNMSYAWGSCNASAIYQVLHKRHPDTNSKLVVQSSAGLRPFSDSTMSYPLRPPRICDRLPRLWHVGPLHQIWFSVPLPQLC